MARVDLTFADGLAELRLARPDARNAIDLEWTREFATAVEACAGADAARAVLITAEGPTFTVGGDLRFFTENADRMSDALDETIGPFHRGLAQLADLPVPVVSAVRGAAAGGGLGLLWCSDLVVLAEDAVLATGFANLGLSGDGGCSWYLPRMVGLARAAQLTLGGRVLTAAEALEWGLVSKLAPADRVEGEARALARRLADGPTGAFAEMRRLLRGAFSRSFAEQLSDEHAAMVRTGASADAREGVTAFVERREPRFEGR